MYKILVGLMVAVLVIGALIAVVGAGIGFFTNNLDMISCAVMMILSILLLGVVFGLMLDVVEISL